MTGLITQLSRRIHSLGSSELSPAAIRDAQLRLVDSIACALGASREALVTRLRRSCLTPSSAGGARIWGTDDFTTAESAAFINGVMVRYSDFNDTTLGRAGGGHPSDMIPALFALAETRKSTGIDLLTSIVVAYELYCGLCAGAFLSRSGIDQAVAAALGAAGGASYLMDLDESATANALSLAVAANVALLNTRVGNLSEWKACAGPNAAKNGLTAAALAADGMTGPSSIFEGPGGLQTIVGEIEWPDSGDPLVSSSHLKLHPVCYHGQAAVEAAIQLHRRIDAAHVDRVIIGASSVAIQYMAADRDRWDVSTRETADHSLPYVTSVALLKGGVEMQDFDEQALRSPAVRDLMMRVEVEESPAYSAGDPDESPARITVELSDGRSLVEEVTLAPGHSKRPASAEMLEAKLTMLLAPDRSPAHARKIIVRASQLPAAPDVSGLSELLG